MKTLFVVSVKKVNDHVGEEYDAIIEVPHIPTTETLPVYAKKIMEGIQELWKQSVGDDAGVVVFLDAALPFASMLEDLKYLEAKKGGMKILLPWFNPPDPEQLDKESKEVLAKLNRK